MLSQDGPDASQGGMPLQIKVKLGQKAYAATRDRILRHMETFVEDIYDLHRLTRRQHHLEGRRQGEVCGRAAAVDCAISRAREAGSCSRA